MPNVNIDEDEDIEEVDEEPGTVNTYKVDKCVICLTNAPNVLLMDCKHNCMCEDCEKLNKITKCPYCREKIKTKLII